jgi:hypothetical protein
MSDPERRTLKSWAGRLSVADEPLTLPEATLLALISCNDRLVEMQVKIEELAGRYQQLDEWMEANVAGYRRRPLRAIKDGDRA